MATQSSIRNLFARPVTRPIRKAPHRARLSIESLEDRTVPSRFAGTDVLDTTRVPVPSPAGSTGETAFTGSFPSTAHLFLASHSANAAVHLDGGGGSSPTSIPYNGGSLLTQVQVQGVYYNDPTTLGFQSQMDGFFTNIVQSPWVTQMLANFSIGSQTIGAGSFLGDDITGLTFQGQGLIQSQLSSELAQRRLAAPNGNTLYAIFVPSGSLGGQALGYHSAFIDPSSGKVIYYMVIDSLQDPNFTEFQGRTVVTSHELSEAITDPGVGLRTPTYPGGDVGWLSNQFDEIGDVSEGTELVTYHGYVMQEEWGRSPTDPPLLALGPVVAPADTDFAVTQVKNDPTEGANNGVFATFTDKDGAAESPSQFSVTVAWGDGFSSRSDDGSGNVFVTSNGDGTFNVVGRHRYSGEAGTTYGGHFPGLNVGITGASVFVSSGDEAALTTVPVTFREAGPLTNVSARSFSEATGQALTDQVVATFTDPGGTAGADPDTSEYRASIDWGDGTANDTNVTILPNGNGNYTVLGNSHIYTGATGNPYQVTVTITHDGATNVVVGQANATVATTFTVTDLLDDGSVGSLRWAVGQANSTPGFTTINFDRTVFNRPQTIQLTGTPIKLSNTSEPEIITGPAAGVTVSGAGLSRVFQVDGAAIASLSGLTITGGNTPGNGGGLDNAGGLTTLTNCTVSGNSANRGGGLYDNGGVITLTNCTVSGNSATFAGGGVYNKSGITTLTNCTVVGNSAGFGGGGIYNSSSGAAALTGCTVSGNSAGVVGGGLLDNYSAAALTGCTVSGNSASYGGGLFDLDDTAALTNCTVSGNSAAVNGGGLYLFGSTAALTNCTVSGNSANNGGGLFNTFGTATLTNCTVTGNSANNGGGLENRGTSTLTDCTVSDNSAAGEGGGLENRGTSTLSDCTVSDNSAASEGGGLENRGTSTLTNCTVSDNSATFGGGLENFGAATLSGCLVSGNSATYNGGGFDNSGTAALTNCTVSGNSAGFGGGLSAFAGAATLTDCTVSGNSAGYGGGLANAYGSGEAVVVGNTIVAGNTASSAPDAIGTINSAGHNLIGAADNSSGWVSSDLTGTGATPLNPLLAPLGDYGGAIPTMALLPGSPAIDAGSSVDAPANDQRGLGRFGAVDIGAFESQGFTLASVAGSIPQTATIGTPFHNGLAVIVTANNPVEPVDGGVVTFVAHPAADGASALFPSSSVIGNTQGVILNHQAAVAAGPNNVDGAYQVAAAASGAAAPVSFDLTNTGPVFKNLIVNSTSGALFAGAGLLSLREAILFADADQSGHAKITFDPKVFNTPQTITLTGTQLELSNTSETETIKGPKAGVTVSGGGLSRVFQVDGGVSASLSGLTITGGNTGSGGGLDNLGTATLTDCTVSGNSATTGNGGGLYSHLGTTTLTDCAVTGNSAGNTGGGIAQTYGTTTLTNCTVSGNSAGFGGGVYVQSGTTTLTNCTVSGNSATVGGGLRFAGYGSTATLTNCTVSGNFAGNIGGGIAQTYGTATLTNCTVSGNTAGGNGGGLRIRSATFTLTDCTVSGNSAGSSGGGLNIVFGSTTTLTNCTVSDNSAGSTGGGLSNDRTSRTTLTNSTVSGNSAKSGGGMFTQGTLTVGNTIVAGNTASTSGPDAVGAVASVGHNLVGATDGSTGWVGSDLTGTIAVPLNPLLAPLGNYGGPTQTMPLLPGSPAIDAGTSTGAPAFDQRGEPRVGAVDIGAFESQGFTIAVTGGSSQAANISTAFSATLVVTVTANNPSEPVAGGRVTFTPPSSGASGTLGGSPATISAAGTASVTATANGFAGRYVVTATAHGITTPASFSLANRPILTVPAAQTAYQNVDQPISGILLGDAPSATLTVTLRVGHGTLTLGTTTGLTAVTGNGTGAVTLTGTTANLNAALATLIYRAGHNYSGGDTLSLTVTDSGVGATPASVAITVESIAQEAAALQAQVSALQTAGVLNRSIAALLKATLDLRGNILDELLVGAFLLEVQDLRHAGILTQAQADSLLGPGNILLLSVTQR